MCRAGRWLFLDEQREMIMCQGYKSGDGKKLPAKLGFENLVIQKL